MQDQFGNNDKKLVLAVAKIIKKYRLLTGKSIYTISAESGVPTSTWQDFENAKYKNVNLKILWKISEGLEVPIEKLIAEIRQELGEDFTLIE